MAEEEEEEREAVDYQEKGPREGGGGRKEWKGVTEPLKKRGRGGKKGLWCFCLLLPGNKKGEKVGCSPLTWSAAGWADIACLLWLPSPGPRRRPLCAAEKEVGGGTEKERDVDPEMNFPLVPPLRRRRRRRRRSESSTLSRGFCFKAIVRAIALSFSICSSSQGIALPRALAKSQVKLHTFLH